MKTLYSYYTYFLEVVGLLSRPFSHKGFWRAAQIGGKLIPKDLIHTIRILNDSNFSFQLHDPYWARLCSRNYVYEPEILWFFSAIKGIEFALLDCGANLGYWTVFCTSKSIGCRTAIAVEASPSTFALLCRNREINQARFQVLNRAIFHKNDELVHIHQSGQNHAGASLQASGLPVRTITIDSAVQAMDSSDQLPLVVKLDVEGVEIEAMQGAQATLSKDVIFIYEDHGNDIRCLVTDYMLKTLGLEVFFLKDDKNLIRITGTNDAASLKSSPHKGYNFFATRCGSSFFRLLNNIAVKH